MAEQFSLPKSLFLAALLGACTVPASSQALEDIETPKELHAVIAALDARLFDSFNRCEVEKFAAFFDPAVEFYHDRTGLAVGVDSLTQSLKENICGKVSREIVPESLQVYPMKGFGAVELGVHRFHHPGRDDIEPVGEAKFIHLWRSENGSWKITRVISYDHQSLKN
jgi:hypothetical protein